MQKIETNGLPIFSWCSKPERGALEQAENLAMLKFAFRHIVLLPDAHQGYGMPIGGVLATIDNIIPNAVGVDIGCGVRAVETSLTEINSDTLKEICTQIKMATPLGFEHHKRPQGYMPKLRDMQFDELDVPVVSREFSSADRQIGTLGGGNHFIEIQKSDTGNIWLMLHSGSRHLGFTVANHYNKLAKQLNEKMSQPQYARHGLAFLPVKSKEFQLYLNEMNYCLNFAKTNRELMMKRIKEIFCVTTSAKILQEFDVHHNYAAKETHFGKEVFVHRKGAISAREGELGIVPGSQGTSSYIVKGKGNALSFNSCSHGAGRQMSRKGAVKNLSLEEEQKKLSGILHSVRSAKDLDEAPGAYKDIDEVMREQEDLAEIETALSPLAVIKG
ncbi:MAG TPA: RtcB family protein [Elusimicrobiales bacterium]|nr:RtcB family protein [Elusimicrobiales bacterium]